MNKMKQDKSQTTHKIQIDKHNRSKQTKQAHHIHIQNNAHVQMGDHFSLHAASHVFRKDCLVLAWNSCGAKGLVFFEPKGAPFRAPDSQLSEGSTRGATGCFVAGSLGAPKNEPSLGPPAPSGYQIVCRDTFGD